MIYKTLHQWHNNMIYKTLHQWHKNNDLQNNPPVAQ